jgi:hypothetical protein
LFGRADTPIVEQWEAAKASGRLVARVRVNLSPNRSRKGKGGLHIGLKMEILREPMDAPVEFDQEAGERLAQERMLQSRARQDEEECQARLAKHVIIKVPWAIRYALLAANDSQAGRADIEKMARTDTGRLLLRRLGEAQHPADVKRAMEAFGKRPIRVPIIEKNEALMYTVIIGRGADGAWGVRRYEGPHAQTQTKLTREVGCANLLSVKIEEPSERLMLQRTVDALEGNTGAEEGEGAAESLQALIALHELLQMGFEVGGRQFSYLAHKIEHNQQDAKLIFVAIGKQSVVLQPSGEKGPRDAAAAAVRDGGVAAIMPLHWSCTGGSILGGWETADQCRALFADFESLEVPKMAKRLQLLFSPTTRCLAQYELRTCDDSAAAESQLTASCLAPPSDECVVQIIEADDLFGDENDRKNSCLTDGAGRISKDLMRGMPSLESGRLMAEQRVDDDDADDEKSAATVVQGRLWYAGSLAKGLWVIDSTLPARTIIVGKHKQRKIQAYALSHRIVLTHGYL